MKKKIYISLIIVLALVMIISGVLLVRELLQSSKENEQFEDIANLVMLETDPDESYYVPVRDTSKPAPSEESGSPSEESGEEISQEPAEPEIIHKRNLQPLFDRNGDSVGWIYVHNSAINYPVMHTPRQPQKYLHRDIDGEYSFSGVPFLQWNCTTESDNLLIYAHNMKNGTMFADVKNYRDRSFYEEHRYIEFETAEGVTFYEVFAVVRFTNNDDWYDFINARNQESYDKMIKYIKRKALYEIDFTPTYDQQLITLSTCYGGDDADRIVVIGAAIN